jgi:hypothetical protein
MRYRTMSGSDSYFAAIDNGPLAQVDRRAIRRHYRRMRHTGISRHRARQIIFDLFYAGVAASISYSHRRAAA